MSDAQADTYVRLYTLEALSIGVAQRSYLGLPFFEWNQICSGTDSESRRESARVMNRSNKRKRIRHGHVSERWPIVRSLSNARAQNLARIRPIRRPINTKHRSRLTRCNKLSLSSSCSTNII